jgi:hypothetical protein
MGTLPINLRLIQGIENYHGLVRDIKGFAFEFLIWFFNFFWNFFWRNPADVVRLC